MSGLTGAVCADAPTTGTVNATSVTTVAPSTAVRFLIAQASRTDLELTSD